MRWILQTCADVGEDVQGANARYGSAAALAVPVSGGLAPRDTADRAVSRVGAPAMSSDSGHRTAMTGERQARLLVGGDSPRESQEREAAWSRGRAALRVGVPEVASPPSAWRWAVRATTETQSMTMTAGRSVRATRIASSPLRAMAMRYPLKRRYSAYISNVSAKSSTSKTG